MFLSKSFRIEKFQYKKNTFLSMLNLAIRLNFHKGSDIGRLVIKTTGLYGQLRIVDDGKIYLSAFLVLKVLISWRVS